MNNKIPVSHYVEYFLVICLEALINLLPRPVYLRLGTVIGLGMYYAGVYRKVLNANLNHVRLFDIKERPKISKRLYINTVKVWMDFLRSGDKKLPYVLHNLEAATSIITKGKGSLAVLGHIGNWELLGKVFGAIIGDLSVVTRPMKNTLVEKWLSGKRNKNKVPQIYASGSLRKILSVFKRNGMVAILIDQYEGDHGTAVEFLGKPANTVRTVAGLRYKTGCGIVFAYALLEKDNTYRVELEEEPIIDLPNADQETYIDAYQKAHNDVLSRIIIKHPDQYFGWFHRRYKDTISYS